MNKNIPTLKSHIDLFKKLNELFTPEAKELLSWVVKYDNDLKGEELQAIAHFFSLGIKTAYEQSLQTAEPLDEETFNLLASHTEIL